MSLLDSLFTNASAYYLRTADGNVEVGEGASPTVGQVLGAISSRAARWIALPSAGVTSVNTRAGVVTLDYSDVGLTAGQFEALVGTGAPNAGNPYVSSSDARLTNDRTASALRSDTSVVSVSSAAAPTAGAVLTATSGTSANWQSPAPGGVTTFNARGGAVLPQAGDYTAALVGAVPTSRIIIAGTRLSGGGDLTVDRTVSLDSSTDTLLTNAASHIASTANPHVVTASQVGAPPTSRTVSAGLRLSGGGDLSANRIIAVDAATDTLLTSASSHIASTNNPHSATAAQVGAVPTARLVSAGTRLVGGGDLTADRTLSLDSTTDTLLTNTAAHIASTSNPHATTASQVGAVPTARLVSAGTRMSGGGDLTSDRTLSLNSTTDTLLTNTAAHLASASNPHGTTAAQVGAISSAAAGTGIDVVNPTTAPVISVLSSYLAPPLSPNSFDDEFTIGSPDLGARGWIIRNMTQGVIMTRAGDVVPFSWTWSSPQLGRNSYNSTLREGKLCLQFSVGFTDQIFLYKAVTLPTTTVDYGGVIWSRIGLPSSQNASGLSFLGTGFWASSSGLPDNSKHAFMYRGVTANSAQSATMTVTVAGSTTNLAQGNGGDILAMQLIATATPTACGYTANSMTGDDGGILPFSAANVPAPSLIAFAGWKREINDLVSLKNASGLYWIDFMRLRTGNMRTLATSSQWLWP